MVKIGFIVEGGAEKIIISSKSFYDFLKSKNIEIIDIFDAEGEGNFKVSNHKIEQFFKILNNRNVDYIIILTDLEEDPCISYTKDKIFIYNKDKQKTIVSVKTIESWFLADSKTLSKIFKTNDYYFENPEITINKPFEIIKEEFIKHTGRGISKSRNRLAKKMLNNGFNILNSASHPNCRSAKYLIEFLSNLKI